MLFSRPNINFMAIRYYFFAATVLLTLLGAAIFIGRLPSGKPQTQDESGNPRQDESSVLNIDFIGMLRGENFGKMLVKLA